MQWSLWATFVFFSAGSVVAEVVPYLEQGFFFDYAPPGQPVPIPTTQQCETIHITWGRQSATGPNPVAPYSLHVFTSTFIVPFVIPVPDQTALSFDWTVPFAPGTQYQICMFDSQGTTGGCQRMYTVIPNLSTLNGTAPTCQNVTFPAVLGVEAKDATGSALSQFGWPNQCSDISIRPTNGTPPFTLLVAPTLHPPYRIVSQTMDPIIWTVSLAWGQPFFISLESSDGKMWQYGPEHAGGPSSTDCLSPGYISASKAHATTAGAAVGGLIGGALLAVAAFMISGRLKRARRRQTDLPINPFPGKDRSMDDYYPAYLPQSPPQSASGASSLPSPSAERSGPSTRTSLSRRIPVPNQSQVFVVHHDNGPAPVTVYTTNGAELVELPPGYIDPQNGREASETSEAPINLKPLRRSE